MLMCTLGALATGMQDHERIQRAGQERDTSGHLPVRASRWRGSLIHGERLAGVNAHRAQGLCSLRLVQ